MRNRTIVIGLLLVLCATALVTAQQNAETLFRQASGKEQIGDYDGAIPMYERVVRESKDREQIARAKLHLGDCWLKKKEADQAKGLDYLNDVTKNYSELKALVSEANRIKSLIPPATAPGAPLEIKTPFTEDVFSFAISPNGRSLVLQVTTEDGKKQLWLQPVDPGKKPTPIPGTEGAGSYSLPFFSPDGKYIGFFADGKLKRVSVNGGIPQDIAPAMTFRGGTWNKDDVIVFSPGSPLYSIRADGSGQMAVTTPTFSSQASPRFLSDGKRFLFIVANNEKAIFSLGALDNVPQSAAQPENAQAAAFASPDRMVYVADGALMAQRLDPLNVSAIGDSVRLAEMVALNRTWPGIAALSVSAEGPVAYRKDSAANRQFSWVDQTGRQIRSLGLRDNESPSSARISPDGLFVAFHRSAGNAAVGSVWVMDIARGARSQVANAANSAVWSPNTNHMVLGAMDPSKNMDLVDRTSVLDNESRYLGRSARVVRANDWSSKNFLLYESFSSSTPGSPADLMALPLNGGEPVAVTQTPFSERNGRFSPDGAWVAYQSNELGLRNEVFVQPFPGSMNSRKRVSFNGGTFPHWSSDGLQIYFLSADNQLTVVPAPRSENGQDIVLGKAVPLFPLKPGSEYEVAADNKFLINAPTEDAPPIFVLSNWTDKLPAVSPNSTSSPLVVSAPTGRPPGYSAQTQIVMYDRDRHIVGTVKDTGSSPRLSLSPDGSRVAYVRNGDIWVCEIATGASDRIASNIVIGFPPSWSPDGSRIAYLANRNGAQGLYVKASNGTTNEELLYAPVSNIFNWSKDGRFLAITTGSNFAVIPLDSDRKPISIVPTNGKQGLRLAPDSHLVAYLSNESGRNEVYVQPFDPATGTSVMATHQKISTQGSPGLIRWDVDGKGLYYLTLDGRVMAVSDARASMFDEQSSKLLFRVPDNFPLVGTPGMYSDISADGQRFVFALPAPTAPEK